MYHYLQFAYNNDIPCSADIKDVCHRGFGTVINAGAKIGEDIVIQHGVTIDEIDDSHKCPVIGKRCFIGHEQ